MSRQSWRALGALCMVAALAACGGGGDEPGAAGVATVGAAGGTLLGEDGARVVFPQGALSADVTVRIAKDSTGAPPLPPGLAAAGNTYVITPHGGEFAQPVEVVIPAPNVTLQPNQELKLAKAQPGGEWMVLDSSVLQDGKLVAQVDGFSFFAPVTVTYLLPLAQAVPFAITGSSVDCQGQDCQKLVGAASVTWTITTNNGQLPVNCSSGMRLKMGTGSELSSLGGSGFDNVPLSGGSITRQVAGDGRQLAAGLYCGGQPSYSRVMRTLTVRRVPQPTYPRVAVVLAPSQIDAVAGLRANLDVVFNGGASKQENSGWAAPTAANRAEVDWQRSDDDGASWRVVARSYQDEADPNPRGSFQPWAIWGLGHGFVASAADQGALIRAQACYTPPDVPALPCATGPATRINVLQQSALPSIVEAPRSVLIKTGQTASFSATAGGAPSPTLQWQSRAANSTAAWINVNSGNGATTGNFTTPVLSTADNGTQYRVVASNARGSAESAAVTVSVSDLDVAPTISAQPAGLSVTAGSDAAFAIAARGTEALSYQWRKDGIAINGANSPVLRLAAVIAGQAGAYSVTVTNAAGSAISDAAMLTVSAGTPAAVAPTIVTQPVSVLVNAGNTATFAVGASGSGTLNYQWLRDGQPIAGATAAFHSIAQAVAGDGGTYAVQVSNGVGPGVTSFNVVLTVNQSAQPAAVTIGVQPAPQVQTPGGSATFAVAVSGSGPIAYQWLKNGAPIGGATDAVLTLSGITGADMANYSVTVGNVLGSITSNAASLTVLGAPIIGNQPANATATEGSSATFAVNASGNGLLYQWMRNSVGIAGASSASYSTPALTLADSGAVYGVVVYNGAGLVFSQGAVLTVTPAVIAPTVTQQPLDATVNEGQAAPYDMAFAGTPPFTVQFQRFTGGNWVAYAGAVVWNDDGVHRLSTGNLSSAADSGAQFRFVASNASGTVATNTVTVSFLAAPGLTASTLASVATSGGAPNNRSVAPSLSGDGLLVAFRSDGTNLVAGVTGAGHAYLRNLATNTTTLINARPDGGESSRGVTGLKLSANGRYAVFTSLANDLVAGDTNVAEDVFRRDLVTGTTTRLNVLPNGAQDVVSGNAVGGQIDISADGRWVLMSSGVNLAGDGASLPNGYALFLRDTVSGTTRAVAGLAGYGAASLSASGMHLVVANATPGFNHLQVYDVEADAALTVFSVRTDNFPDGIGGKPSISDDGQVIAFGLRTSRLPDYSTHNQIAVFDRGAAAEFELQLQSQTSGEAVGDNHSSNPVLSGDGRYVLFSTNAPNLTGDPAATIRPYLVQRDRQSLVTTVASQRVNGSNVWVGNFGHALSRYGTALAFVADMTNMFIPGQLGGPQVFVAPRP